MTKNGVSTMKDAVHKIQLSLLEGIKHENQLAVSGSLISRTDYGDVVTERTIAKMCGYPLCSNLLPSERPHKGRYRISLKEHKVYDLQETYLYCSTECLINSRAFAASLQEERSSTLNMTKVNEILNKFNGLSSDSGVNMGKSGDLGLSELRIQEKTDTQGGEISLEEWIGSSYAIDGYVPRRDRNLEAQQSNDCEKGDRQKSVGSENGHVQSNWVDILSNDINFTSCIITEDEYSVSKPAASAKGKEQKGKVGFADVNSKGKIRQKLSAPSEKVNETKAKKSTEQENLTIPDARVGASQYTTTKDEKNKLQLGKQSAAGAAILKSSLKSSTSKKQSRSVTWADEKTGGDGQSLCTHKEPQDEEGTSMTSNSLENEMGEDSYRFASAEACAKALSEASEAVASGKIDVSDAVAEAGVIILPPPGGVDDPKSEETDQITDTDPVIVKWPPKPGFSSADLLDSDDSWYDPPPEGFNLTLSPFSTMFMSVFSWISSSSLAYIYGKEESSHEEYLMVNGKEYPQKIVLSDGRSSEIKQTLAGYLARALPGLVTELRIPIHISILEQGMGRLLDTMSFVDPLPALRMKQWQVMVLVFLDALSVSRIPSLIPHLMERKSVVPKVIEGAGMSAEEYEIMKDVVIPLGRVPEFSSQRGA